MGSEGWMLCLGLHSPGRPGCRPSPAIFSSFMLVFCREFTTISASGNKLLSEARFLERGIRGCLAAQIQATLPGARLSSHCDGEKAPWYLIPHKGWSRLSTTRFHTGQLEFWKLRLSCSKQVMCKSFFHCAPGGKGQSEGEMAPATLTT